jgi:hypothetical protein
MNKPLILHAIAAIVFGGAAYAHAGIVSITTGDVLVGDRTANLMTNGNFETGHSGGTVDKLVGWCLRLVGRPARVRQDRSAWHEHGLFRQLADDGFRVPSQLRQSAKSVVSPASPTPRGMTRWCSDRL